MEEQEERISPRAGFTPTWIGREAYEKASRTRRTNDKTEHIVTMRCDYCGSFFDEYPKRRRGKFKYCDNDCKQLAEMASQ